MRKPVSNIIDTGFFEHLIGFAGRSYNGRSYGLRHFHARVQPVKISIG